MALVIGAGLLLRTVMNLSNVDSGFNRGQLVTFAVTLPNASTQSRSRCADLYERLLDAVARDRRRAERRRDDRAAAAATGGRERHR